MIKVGTLFSGGLAAVEFALRYEELNHEIVFACEWDKFARQQYLHFHSEPTSNFYNDVSDMSGHKYKDTLDLMVWGSPCQDLSLAGKRKGFDGAKSSLFREGARVMSEVMPKAFIFENVKGLLSSNGGADYQEVIKTFQEMGYLIAMKVMNTKDYGVPQNRERVFIVGFLDEDAYHSFNFEDENKTLIFNIKDILETERPILQEWKIKSFTSGKSVFKDRFSIKEVNDKLIANCLDTRNPRDRRTQTFFYVEDYVSYFTPKECYRLQGVKDSCIDLVVSDSQAYKIAGNAISVNVMQSLLRSLYNPVANKGSLF